MTEVAVVKIYIHIHLVFYNIQKQLKTVKNNVDIVKYKYKYKFRLEIL